MTIDQFLDALDAFDGAIPIDELTGLLADLELSISDVDEAVRFDESQYTRNLLREGSAYQALILCWRPGQASPIHDHRGSSCGVRVLRGTMSEVVFERGADGRLTETETNRVCESGVCGSYDGDIHEVLNEQPSDELITLHVYSPPLANYRRYDRDSTAFQVVENVTTTEPAPIAE